VRIVVIVLGLAGAVWFGVAARSFSAQDRIGQLALADRTPTKADLAEAQSLVTRAQTLNPDVRVEQGIAVLQFRTGDPKGATATFKRLTAKEPENSELWALLARTARDVDPALAQRASAKARELSPPIPDE